MLSESEVCDEFRVVTDSVLPGVKSHGLPGQKEVDRLSAPPDPKSGRLLKLWDDKVTKWFLEIHDHSKGHTGLKRTMSKLFELPDFQRMSLRGLLPLDLEGRIAEKIKSCNTCQKNSSLKPTTQGSHFSCSVYKKMNRIAVDYIESLKPDAEGNDMIVVIIDCFSRFICLYPVKNKGTEVFLHSYLQWIGMGFGDPSEILTDRGSQFTSKLTAELSKAVGITMVYTTADSKEENAIVERANREIMRHLRNIIMDKRAIDEWGKNVPLVQRIMNSMVHSSTGVRPSSIIYSEEIDPSIIKSSGEADLDNPLDEWEGQWLERLRSSQQIFIDNAIKSLSDMDKKRRALAPVITSSFNVGDLVLSEQGTSFRRGPESKLLPLLAGPFEVMKRDGDIYTLRNVITNKLRDIHLGKLHSYNRDNNHTSLEAAAITDYADMYIIDHIVTAHPKNIMGKSVKIRNLKFKVRWVGYGAEGDTYQSWGTLRKTPQFRSFIENHPNKGYKELSKYLPQLEGSDDEEMQII
jgi:hypothetical protein